MSNLLLPYIWTINQNKFPHIKYTNIDEEITACSKCQKANQYLPLIGQGSNCASWMFIVNAPTTNDCDLKQPLSGERYALFLRILKALKLSLERDVFLTNIVKCHFSNYRHPQEIELNNCKSHLLKQINIIKPKIIVLFGIIGAQSLLGLNCSLLKARESIYQINQIPVIITFDLEYLLRKPSVKAMVWQDLQKGAKECSHIL